MKDDTSYTQVLFTVTCGALNNDDCPSEGQLAPYRVLSERPLDPKLTAQWLQDRKEKVDELRAKTQADEFWAKYFAGNEPSLIEIGHYRMVTANRVGRDVFLGLVRVPDYLFAREAEGSQLLGLVEPDAQVYFGTMFSQIFDTLELPDRGDAGFCWLTWVVVPLGKLFNGNFNPLGMGGVGKC